VTWTDVDRIAETLAERRPLVSPLSLRFTDLYRWIVDLPGFTGHPDHCNERILEAVQAAWLREIES
jgi:FeS assembly protein IscX